jgi:hypothetical protein
MDEGKKIRGNLGKQVKNISYRVDFMLKYTLKSALSRFFTLVMADFKQQILNGLKRKSFFNFVILALFNGYHFQVNFYE